jgi:hypothetical protein
MNARSEILFFKFRLGLCSIQATVSKLNRMLNLDVVACADAEFVSAYLPRREFSLPRPTLALLTVSGLVLSKAPGQ